MRLSALNSVLTPTMTYCISFQFYIKNLCNNNFPPPELFEEKKTKTTKQFK